MENRKEKKAWMSVPQFGGWDHKSQKATDYSVVFQRARENRKENKNDFRRESADHEAELVAQQQDQSPSKRKKILTYLNCCIKA